MMMEDDDLEFDSMPFLNRPASRDAKKEEVRRCLEELRSVLSGTGVPLSGNTTLETLKATIETLTKARHDSEHREIREDGFRLVSGHQPLPFLDETSYMLRISLEEGEILSVDRNLLDLLNYPEQSWRTCQLASFLCISDIPCLLSCLMRLQKRRQLRRASGAGTSTGTGPGAGEKQTADEKQMEDSSSKELMSERCMFRLRVGPSVSKGTYSLENRNTLMVPFVVEISLWPAAATGPVHSMGGGTTSSDRTRIAMMTASSETTSFVGSSMRSSSATAQAHMSREHVRMTLHRLNHAYQKTNQDRKIGVRDGKTSASDERTTSRQKPISFSSCLRRNSGLIVMASMESDLQIDGDELFKEVALAAVLGYLPQDIYTGLSIFDMVHPADLKELDEPLKKVISPHVGPGKPWVSSPPVRWRCLNASHALIETRFRLSDNAQSIFCRHRVIMEPQSLDNFFDSVDVPLGQLEMKDADGLEATKLRSLRDEWRVRFNDLLNEQWSVPRSPTHPFNDELGPCDMPSEQGAQNPPGHGKASASQKAQTSQQQHPQTLHSSKQQQQPLPGPSEASKQQRRLSCKDSCRHRRPVPQEKDQRAHEVPGDLCYDTWSHLERVQGYLASVAGIESTTSPPSHVRTTSAGASVLEAQAQSGQGGDSSFDTSHLAHNDYQEQEAEQRMQTDAMADAMAAAAAAAVGMSPTWSEDLATTSAASLTVENLARHTREQEMAYKRHLWRHLQREHERAAADRTEPKTPRRLKRRRLRAGAPQCSGPNSPNAAAAGPANKRPFLAAAPPNMFSYMWMIPVMPPVPPYLLFPNLEASVPPAVNPASGLGVPMMTAVHYPPGWDVGVLSNEWSSHDDSLGNGSNCSEEGVPPDEVAREAANARLQAPRDPESETRRRRRRSRAEQPEDQPAGDSGAASGVAWRRESAGRPAGQEKETADPCWRVPTGTRVKPRPKQAAPEHKEPQPTTSRDAQEGRKENESASSEEKMEVDGGEANETISSPRDTSACSSLFLYDDSSASNSARQAGRKPAPFWMSNANCRPVLKLDDNMTYQIPVPEDNRRNKLLFKCHMNRLQQPEMVTNQLLEMLDLDEGLNFGDGTSEDGLGNGSVDDDDVPDVDRIISHLLLDVDSTFSSITSSCDPNAAMMQVSDDGDEEDDAGACEKLRLNREKEAAEKQGAERVTDATKDGDELPPENSAIREEGEAAGGERMTEVAKDKMDVETVLGSTEES